MKIALVVAAALALAIGGCKTLDGGATRFFSKNHHIVVTVFTDSSGRPQIEVDAERLKIRGQGHNVFWDVDNDSTQNYAFPDDGIRFVSEEGRRQFECERLNDKRFKCKANNTMRGEFKYIVKLNGTPSVSPLDPWIINN